MHHFHVFRVIFMFVVFSSSFAANVKNICAWARLASNGETHYSFLRPGPDPHGPQHPLPGTARLYHSVWSRDRRALLRCSWVDDAAVIENYLSLCRENTRDFSENHSESLNVNALFATNRLCDAVSASAPVGDEERARRSRKARDVSRRRVKRGFIVPGTLWCGSGNKALSYADLGTFSETDSCCREHDQCQHTVLSFQSKFGVFNRNIFTMSHCDCDKRFQSCLKNTTERISSVVGYTFFNLLKLNCFELSYTVLCTERNWFGMCKATKTVLQAEVQSATPYETSAYTFEENATQATPPPSATPPTDPPSMTSDPVAGTSPAASTGVFAATLESSASLTPTSNSVVERPNLSTANADKPGLLNGRTTNTSQQLSCEVYRVLDQCRARIRPQQIRYGLLNPDTRTLYHCSCTNRLFQSLANQRRLSDVDMFFLDRVSQSCFLVPDCGAGKICRAIVHSPALPHLEVRLPGADMEEWLHLLAVRLQVRKPNALRVKRKPGAVKLRRLCERITRSKAHKTMAQ